MIGDTLRGGRSIPDVLRYPVGGSSGRTGLAALWGALVAVAIGLRAADAFAPSALALLPAAASSVVFVLALGYLSRVLVDDGPEPPTPALRRAARDGAIALGPTVGLLGPPVGLLLLAIPAGSGGGASPAADAPTLFLVGSTAAIVLFLACAYLLPAAVAAAVQNGRLRDAPDAATLLAAVSDPAYLSGWALGFPLVVVAFGLGSAAAGASDVVGLLSALAAAYLLLAAVRAIGRGFGSTGGATRAASTGGPS